MKTSETIAIFEKILQRLIETGIVAKPEKDGTYRQATTKPQVFYKYQPAKPARCITITPYRLEQSPNPANPVRTWSIQIRCRDTAPADLLADQIHQALEGHGWDGIARFHRESTAQMGKDQNGWDERADNYQAIENGTQTL